MLVLRPLTAISNRGVSIRNLGGVGVEAANRGRVRLPSDSVVFVII